MRVAAVLNVPLIVGLVALGAYYMIWCPMRDTGRWTRGRDLAVAIQAGIVGFAGEFLYAYLIIPAFLPGDEAWRGFMALNMGALLLEQSLVCRLTTRFVESVGRKYDMLLSSASAAAGVGLVHSGICWLADWPRPRLLEVFFLAVAGGTCVLTEMVFLRHNRWRFLPRRLK